MEWTAILTETHLFDICSNFEIVSEMLKMQII